MKRKSTREHTGSNSAFWLLALWPLICLAIVSLGFLAADLIKAL
jgi:hypothetical protein